MRSSAGSSGITSNTPSSVRSGVAAGTPFQRVAASQTIHRPTAAQAHPALALGINARLAWMRLRNLGEA